MSCGQRTEALRAIGRRMRRAAASGDTYDRSHPERPRTRGDCRHGVRPCPWASCRYHLAVDINSVGGLKHNMPARSVGYVDTCSLDVADRGGASYEQLAEALDVSYESINQWLQAALVRLARAMPEVVEQARGERATNKMKAQKSLTQARKDGLLQTG